MAERTYTPNQFKQLLAATLRKGMEEWENVLVDLRKRELAKGDEHYEPGNHETPDTGVAPHLEPGTHEDHAFGPGGLRTQIGEEPVGSDTGVPMNGQPPNSTPGGEVCPMCNQPDLPGSCQCLAAAPAGGDVDGFDRPDADLGADADLGGGDLRMSEKPLVKAQKRKVTAHQVKAMAAKKNEVMGYGGQTQGMGGDTNAGQGDISSAPSSLAQSEMKKDLASATADLKSKNQMLDAANKVRAPKYGLGDQKPMPKFTKEEWIDISNEGDPVKRLKNFPEGSEETPVPASATNKGAKKRGQGVESKHVASADDHEVKPEVKKGEKGDCTHVGAVEGGHCRLCNAKVMPDKVKKAEVPQAKPPSGVNMGTAVPKAKVQAPKLPGPAAPAAPKTPRLPGFGKSPKLGGMIQAGSGTPAGVVKTEELEKSKVGKLATAALAAGSLMTGAMVKPQLDHAKAKVTQQAKPAPTALAQKAEMAPQKQASMQANGDAHRAHLAQGAAPAPAVKLPGQQADAARHSMYQEFMPKPNVPGLKAPSRLPGAGRPVAKPAPKPIFGKAEMNDLKCSMCGKSEHNGGCC